MLLIATHLHLTSRTDEVLDLLEDEPEDAEFDAPAEGG